MDENYLDRLLKEAEEQNKDSAPDSEPMRTSALDTTVTESSDELEHTLDHDAGKIQDVAWSDAEIPTEDLADLDDLDDLADLDMDSMNFDDIDFDDIDVTKMNPGVSIPQAETDPFSDMDIDEHYLDDSDDDFEAEFQKLKHAEEADSTAGALDSTDMADSMDISDPTVPIPASDDSSVASDASKPGDDLDTLMDEIFGSPDTTDDTGTEITPEAESAPTPKTTSEPEATPASEPAPIFETALESETSQANAEASGSDMDDLFAMLGIEHTAPTAETDSTEEEIPDFEIPEELKDVTDISKAPKKKRGFMDVLFGEDEDEEPTPEQLEAIEQEKEEKKQAKLEKKKEKQAKKAEANEKKKKSQDEKTARLAAKKAAIREAEAKELATEGPPKKLNKVLVVIVMLFFLGIGGVIIAGTNIFDYTQVVVKASNYFERQKYGLAYRELLGVDLKKHDQELGDKVTTVMYVERQYEAYQNYVTMDRPDLALDALIQGLARYDQYYDTAASLDIASDMDTVRDMILRALDTDFHLSLTDAEDLLTMDAQTYTDTIMDLTDGMSYSNTSEQ